MVVCVKINTKKYTILKKLRISQTLYNNNKYNISEDEDEKLTMTLN